MESPRRIAVYMGSFDPVHKGHIAIARHLMERDYADELLFVPTGNYWTKQGLTPVEDRIRMLQFYETDRIHVETEYNLLPYTYQLMQKLQEKYPEARLIIVMGADSVVHFDRWVEYRYLLEHFPFLLIRRDDVDIDYHMKRMGKTDYRVTEELPLLQVSSHEIREHLWEDAYLEELLDPEVKAYYRELSERMNRKEADTRSET